MGTVALKTQNVMGKQLLILAAFVAVSSGCFITVGNVGQKDFHFHNEFAGTDDQDYDLTPGDHITNDCTCLPHDFFIYYGDFYCYLYMNCVENKNYQVEVTDYAIYINPDGKTQTLCLL